MEERTKMGLVEYIGQKVAPFTVSFLPTQGRATNRMWAIIDNEASKQVKRRRWLPEEEALFYNALADFRLIRWGADVVSQKTRTPIVTSFSEPIPEPQALPLHVILQQQAAAMAKAAPPDALITKSITEAEPIFVMSQSGTVHKPDCSSAKRIKEPKSFYTAEEATADKDFKKFHSCCGGLA